MMAIQRQDDLVVVDRLSQTAGPLIGASEAVMEGCRLRVPADRRLEQRHGLLDRAEIAQAVAEACQGFDRAWLPREHLAEAGHRLWPSRRCLMGSGDRQL